MTDALAKVVPPVIRWPGGRFADAYHWRDGIGSPEYRPVRVTNRWGWTRETNAFGTHEFIAFCRRVGAKPWLGGNVATGTPQELAEWCEYCNFDGETRLTWECGANGDDAPMKSASGASAMSRGTAAGSSSRTPMPAPTSLNAGRGG